MGCQVTAMYNQQTMGGRSDGPLQFTPASSLAKIWLTVHPSQNRYYSYVYIYIHIYIYMCDIYVYIWQCSSPTGYYPIKTKPPNGHRKENSWWNTPYRTFRRPGDLSKQSLKNLGGFLIGLLPVIIHCERWHFAVHKKPSSVLLGYPHLWMETLFLHIYIYIYHIYQPQ